MRIIQAADRAGWAIDKLAKPMAQLNENVDIAYICADKGRYLATGYTPRDEVKQFSVEMANQYDVVHFHDLRHLKFFSAKLKKGIKKIVTIHTEREEDLDKNDLTPYDAIICPTKKVEENVIKRGGKGIWVPHCIELNKFKNPFTNGDEKTIGYVGRVVVWKRFDVILKAVYDAGLKLLGCGYIQDKEVFHRYKGKIVRDKDFEFDIFVPDNELVNFYSRMNLLVCLSKDGVEAGPLPVLEAMALGIPVLSTKIGWARDNATHGENILFIEEKDIKNLSSIIKNIYDNIEVRNRLKNGGLELIKNYGMESYSEKLMEIYGQA